MSDKNAIRSEMKILRKNFSGGERAAADAAVANFFLREFGGAESFFIYNGFSSEARTDLITAELAKAGKSIYLPRVEGGDMVAVPLGGEMKKGAFGISEPDGSPYNGVAQVTVVPLLCVNPRGFRIGYGGGYYDRYLRDKKTLKVGMGYGFQMKDFPEEPFDVPLDAFVCERGITFFGGGKG